MAEDKDYIGRGWSFPPSFSARLGGVEMVSGTEDINQSLHILLSTSLGERVMQPDYGANLNNYLFDGLNNAMISFLEDLVANAIRKGEPRIEVESIQITPPDSVELLEGSISIGIDYIVASTNSRANYVFPFYLNEANTPI